MNWKSFILGLGAGFVGGFLTNQLLMEKKHVSPEKALAHAKEIFKQTGPISGSWIQMKAEPYEKEHSSYTVYRGGISRTVNGQPEQYEFIVDAFTGDIIDTKKIHI